MRLEKTDILVIGSGIAGLLLALKASRAGSVTIVTKKEGSESNTYYAQGGIAAVAGVTDSFELHIRDTIEAGQGLCNREAVEITVREGPERVAELVEMGVRFSRDERDGSFSLGREGGHSEPRIIHYGDITGRELEKVLLEAVRKDPRITFLDKHLALDLVPGGEGRVGGCYILDAERDEIIALLSGETVLATGGAGKIYLYTSNPDVASGDGIAMAYRAGAEISNLEFVQFHPTSLYHPQVKSLLISEALRGEGAVLRNTRGEEFMKEYDPRGELAPRDIVARAIDREMKKSGEKYKVGRFSYAASGKAVSMGETDGFIKLVSNEETGRIVGATIAGANASEIISEIAIAMRMEASPGDIVTTIHTHPTLSEVVLEASEDTMGLAIHKMGRKAQRG